MITGVRAIGRKSLKHSTAFLFGAGMMVVDFRHVGTTASCSERLKMLVNTPAS